MCFVWVPPASNNHLRPPASVWARSPYCLAGDANVSHTVPATPLKQTTSPSYQKQQQQRHSWEWPNCTSFVPAVMIMFAFSLSYAMGGSIYPNPAASLDDPQSSFNDPFESYWTPFNSQCIWNSSHSRQHALIYPACDVPMGPGSGPLENPMPINVPAWQFGASKATARTNLHHAVRLFCHAGHVESTTLMGCWTFASSIDSLLFTFEF